MRQQLNVRISPLTRQELDWLKAQYGMSEGEIIMLAIDHFYYRAEGGVRPLGKELSREIVNEIISGKAVLPHDGKIDELVHEK